MLFEFPPFMFPLPFMLPLALRFLFLFLFRLFVLVPPELALAPAEDIVFVVVELAPPLAFLFPPQDLKKSRAMLSATTRANACDISFLPKRKETGRWKGVSQMPLYQEAGGVSVRWRTLKTIRVRVRLS